MSTAELERVEVMGRVAKGGLKLLDAAVMLQLSYCQVNVYGDVIGRWVGKGGSMAMRAGRRIGVMR